MQRNQALQRTRCAHRLMPSGWPNGRDCECNTVSTRTGSRWRWFPHPTARRRQVWRSVGWCLVLTPEGWSDRGGDELHGWRGFRGLAPLRWTAWFDAAWDTETRRTSSSTVTTTSGLT